jgi:inosose dehydratase
MRGAGAAVAAAAVPKSALAGWREAPLYPPMDLSYFDQPITPAASEIRWGYAAITWGGDDRQAIKDISAAGFRGIQLRTSVLKEFGERPQALREMLEPHRLPMTAFSSGGVRIEPGKEADQIALHTKHARFVREVGGFYLQLTDSARPKERQPVAEDYKKLGRMLTEISKRVVDLGVQVGYHNHMNNLGEAPDEVDRILHESDPRYVKLLLDVAHYAQGGGDPAQAIRRYRDRLLFLHIKDVESVAPAPEVNEGRPYRFVELGRGRVNLPAVFAALTEIKFRGWAIVELDAVPDQARTPKESALIGKQYVEEKLGLKI